MYGIVGKGGISLTSIVYGDDFESEQNIEISKEETAKLMEIMTLEEFIEFCRAEKTYGLKEMLEKHNIQYKSHTF